MAAATIEAHGVGKHYRLGEQTAAYGTLRDSLVGLLRRGDGGSGQTREIWALRDVDLGVHEGEAMGLIGSNGAGKTTLLRILARITQPSVGVTRTRGRVGALLEVGTGFHPELSGRDNVFLSGAVMGMTRRDIRRRFDEIVAFAGVEAFVDTPLKRYSSGMRLRLAFAVAAHLEPELMLVDEVLAVGDYDFQRRCLNRMAALREEGRTVVFVSHDLGAITRLCSRALWIDHGRVAREGAATDVVEAYLGSILAQADRVELPVEGPVGIRSVALVDNDGNVVQQPRRGQPLSIDLRLTTTQHIPGLDVAVIVLTSDGTRLLDECWTDQPDIPELAPGAGEWEVRLKLPALVLAADYVLSVWLGTESVTFMHRELLAFQVAPLPTDRHEFSSRRRLVAPAVTWSSRQLGPAGDADGPRE